MLERRKWLGARLLAGALLAVSSAAAFAQTTAAPAPAATQTGSSPDAARASDGSLGIGSLKGESRDE